MNQASQEHRGIRIKPRSRIALVALALVAALLVCAGVTHAVVAYVTTVSQPTSVRIAPLDRTIMDMSQVRMLYDTVLALPTAGFGTCAAKPTPEAYVLTFYRNGQCILTARAGFCPGVSIRSRYPERYMGISGSDTRHPPFGPGLRMCLAYHNPNSNHTLINSMREVS